MKKAIPILLIVCLCLLVAGSAVCESRPPHPVPAELRLSENTSCMICGDVGDLTGGGRTALLCELELELKQGSEEALSAFARALMDTYHLSEQPLSKLQRARALAE